MEEIKVLKDENKRLKESLKQEQCRTEALQKIILSGKVPIEDSPILSRMKAENEELRKKLKNIEELNARIRELERELALVAKGHNWKKAVDKNVLRSHKKSAYMLCYAVQGYKVREIAQVLYKEHNIDVTERTVYRSLSVKEADDYERLISLYSEFPEIFDEYGISKKQIKLWYTSMRTKKKGTG